MLAIAVTDPLAENLNDIHDIEKLMPGFLAVSFTQPILFCVHRPHLLIYFDEMLYGSLY